MTATGAGMTAMGPISRVKVTPLSAAIVCRLQGQRDDEQLSDRFCCLGRIGIAVRVAHAPIELRIADYGRGNVVDPLAGDRAVAVSRPVPFERRDDASGKEALDGSVRQRTSSHGHS